MFKMDSAYLRIKFIPLLKQLNIREKDSSSKCCIEILPEVSAYENLDKINWTAKDDHVEYTIPMTYKVLIKKQENVSINETDKVYHSCVDLLQNHSLTATNLGSGDVTKIISETSFPRRLISYRTEENDDFIEIDDKSLYEIPTELKSVSVATQTYYRTSNHVTVEDKCSGDRSYKRYAEKVPQVNGRNNSYKVFKESKRIGYKQIVHEGDVLTNDVCKETLINQYKLSVCPTCSIDISNTVDIDSIHSLLTRNKKEVNDFDFDKKIPQKCYLITQHAQTDNKTDSKMVKFQEAYNLCVPTINARNENCIPSQESKLKINFDRNLINFDTMSKMDYRAKRNFHQLSKDFESKTEKFAYSYLRDTKPLPKSLRINNPTAGFESEDNSLLLCNLFERKKFDNPEIRVARMIQILENEIFPLKLMMNDLKNKCLMLGISLSEKGLLYKSVSNISESIVTESSQKAKSNRVVYTFMFNG